MSETVTTNFVGGANSSLVLSTPVISNSVVTLTWSASEGGTYRVEASGKLPVWTTNATGVSAVLNRGTVQTVKAQTNQFFRVVRTALATYDSN